MQAAVPPATAIAPQDGGPFGGALPGQPVVKQVWTVQLAQAPGEAVGEVTELIGGASVLRAGGAAQALAQGDPVFEDDELITSPGSSITVTFIDGTLFSLASDGRLVLDRMVYDPAGSNNELLINLLQGSFSFISGQVAKTGGPGLHLDTPVGTIGVRGTAVVGDYDLLRLLVTLLQGQILFSNAVAEALLASAYDTLNVGSANQADLPVHSMTETEQSVYGLLLPKILELVTPEAGEDGQNDGGPAGIRILPFVPDDGGDGTDDDGTGGPRGELPSFLQEALQDIADQIVQEVTQENPNLILLAAGDGGGATPTLDLVGGPADGSFETGFTGWTLAGDTTIETAAFGAGPTDGLNQALITTGDGAQSAADVEGLLGLALGTLTGLGNGTATEGSVITASFTLEAGDLLTFDFNFLTDEIPAPGVVNDFAFVTIDGTTTELADTTAALAASDTRFVDETGFAGVFTFTAPTAGTYQLAIGVMDVDDTVFDSGLLIDNVAVTPAAVVVGVDA